MPVRDKIEMSEEDALLYDEYKEKSEYYDRLQHVIKIKLNSLYGGLSNKYFRFYNLENGESTTATGRKILLHQCAQINKYITGIYDSNGEVVLAGDTDSVTGDTNIEINDKTKSIEDWFKILSQTNPVAHNENKELVSATGYFTPTLVNQNVVPKPMLGIYRHKVKKRMFKIYAENGDCVTVTEDHSLMVLRENNVIEVKPLDILPNDRLILKS